MPLHHHICISRIGRTGTETGRSNTKRCYVALVILQLQLDTIIDAVSDNE